MLNIIVAYRNREQQKAIFIDSLHKFLVESNIQNFRINIIEQNYEKEFNKGCLWNIGFLETTLGEGDYFCFHDIDLLPNSPNVCYQKPPSNSIVHPYGHRHCLGGKILINPDTYQKMNGFSTKYWSWGFEDTDFMLRAKYNDVKIIRDNFTERFNTEVYYELDADDTAYKEKFQRLGTRVNEILFYNTLIDPVTSRNDGLTNTDYEIQDRIEHEKYTLLLCDIKNQNNNIRYVDALNKYTADMNL
jgi:beta-1,4-galactosyltransferase 1